MPFPSKIPADELNTPLVMHLVRGPHSVVGAWLMARDLRRIYAGLGDDEIIVKIKDLSANELFLMVMRSKPEAFERMFKRAQELIAEGK